MWWIFAKNLKDQEILNTIKLVREGRGRARDKAFLSLRDHYNKDLQQRLRSVPKYIDSPNEKRDVQAFIERTFWEILMIRTFDPKTSREADGYIRSILKNRINDSAVKDFLGKTKVIQRAEDYDIQVRKGIHKFHKKFRKRPDFKNNRDLAALAKIMKVNLPKLQEMMKSLGSSMIKSLSESVGGDDEGNVEVLMDTLQSGDKLPDEIYRDRELLEAFKQAIQRYLRPIERKIFMLYYFDDQTVGMTKKELAEEIGMKFPTLKRHLDIGKEKLRKEPVIQELKNASFKTRCIKNAMTLFNIVKIGNKAYFVYDSVNNDEQIIAEVTKSYASR